MRDTLRWVLILAICAGMVSLCVYWLDVGGLWGLIGGAAGFVWGVMFGRFSSWGERFGSGYVLALIGISVGMASGAFVLIVWPELWAYAEQRFLTPR